MKRRKIKILKKNKKVKQEPVYPYKFVRIVFTEQAINNGVLDDFNKKVQLIVNGKQVSSSEYHEADIEAFRKIGIPVIDFTIKKTKDFEFDIIDSLSGTISEVIRT